MQFFGCYLGQSGFMVMDEDGNGNEKEYMATAKPATRTMEVAVKRWPANCRTPGESLHMDYYTVIRPVSGDWFDMATVYRAWALHQLWARKGPLEQAPAVPRWYKEAPAVFVAHCNNSAEPFSVLSENAAGLLKALHYPAGVAAPLFWYTWQAYRPAESIYAGTALGASRKKSGMIPSANVHSGVFFPPRAGFRESIAELGRNNIKPIIFMNTRLFDQGNSIAEQWIPGAVKSMDGKLEMYGPKHPLWDVCRFYKPWQDNYYALSERLIDDYGANGIYLVDGRREQALL